MRTLCMMVCAFCLAVVLDRPAEARTDFPTGVEWTASSVSMKRSYILGIANLMSAARAVDPAVRSTVIGRLYNATRNTTIDQAVARVDRWYAENPGNKDQEVIDVLWLIYVGR